MLRWPPTLRAFLAPPFGGRASASAFLPDRFGARWRLRPLPPVAETSPSMGVEREIEVPLRECFVDHALLID